MGSWHNLLCTLSNLALLSSSLPVSKMEEGEEESDPAKFSDGGEAVTWNPQTTPPLAAKTEEKVRGNVFKVRRTE